MIKLQAFTQHDFDRFISWVDSKELLMQIAGPNFSFPLTTDQLQKYLDDKNSYAFNVIDLSNDKVIGHAEVILSGNDTCKLDKVLIGDKSDRGRGIGLEVINELLRFSFEKLGAGEVELNVFDWNIAGIKCYEKAGFCMSQNKKMTISINGEVWTALNMTIDKRKWLKNHNTQSCH
ncbi:MAG TPA: GNAT family protein [Chitinophagaceae bacterium]|jgi:RimJ/RimL family protein N-acetyltransferase